MAPPKKFKRVVALDGHRLGLISGMAIAVVVMGVSFFYQHAEFLATGIRTGWAFVAGYAATFFLVRVILRTTLFEFLGHERKDTIAPSRLGRTEREEEDELPAPSPEALAPHDLLAQQVGGLTGSPEDDEPVEAEASDELDVQHLGG